jgi:hypothetical protein
MKEIKYYCDGCGVEIGPHGVALEITINGVEFLKIEHGCDDCRKRIKVNVSKAFHDTIKNIKKTN